MKLNSSIIAFLLTLFLLVLSQANFAFSLRQEDGIGAQGTEKPLFKSQDSTGVSSCYIYKQYIVLTVSSEDVGEDIKIFKKNGTAGFRQQCANAQKATPYLTLKNAGENYFYGLTGDKFFVDSGTSAGTRGLEIVSLTTKKSVFSTSYNDEAKVVGNALLYNKPSETKGSLRNCPNAAKWKKQGGGVGWVIPMRIDLTTLKETKAGNLTCIYVE